MQNGINIKELEAVIFDLDGSLVDSMWMWKKIDMEYLERFGISLPENLQQEIEGMSFVETAGYFKEHFQIPDSIEEIGETWNRMAWDKYMYEVPLKPGVMDFLHTCRSHRIKLGIASSNSSALIMNVLKAHHITDFFDCIKSGTDVIKGKPAPDIYLHVAKELNVNPQNCLVFEDITQGILAGKSAGMKVCAVEDAYSSEQWEEKIRLADLYISSYDELTA
ncbi:MAG: HAD family phosphatase [Butyrivibrio sp.]|nr:HAD family phosphatase [Butyrivibrio sp.]